jgi:hypothetical protein
MGKMGSQWGGKKKADSTFELLAIRTLGRFTVFLQHTLFLSFGGEGKLSLS